MKIFVSVKEIHLLSEAPQNLEIWGTKYKNVIYALTMLPTRPFIEIDFVEHKNVYHMNYSKLKMFLLFSTYRHFFEKHIFDHISKRKQARDIPLVAFDRYEYFITLIHL